MTEFALAAYFIAGPGIVTGAFGSGDTGIKDHVLAQPAVKTMAERFDDGLTRIADGLDQIIATKQVEEYNYNIALGVQMLYAAYGSLPEDKPTAVVLGYTEDCLDALKAMNLPALFNAMNTLAWGEKVALPIPMNDWEDVTGQFYFDAGARTAALAELQAIGKTKDAIAKAQETSPEAFDECEPDDLDWTLTFFQSVLSEADSKNMEVAVFRHGGV